MAFRDDIDAAYARLEVLESENRKLVEENALLCRRATPVRPPIPEDHDAVLARIDELERENSRLVAENERFRNGAPLPPLDPPQKPWPGSDTSLPEPSPNMIALLLGAFVIVAGIVKVLMR